MMKKVRDVVADAGFDPEDDESSGQPCWSILLNIKDDFEQCIYKHRGLCLIALKRHVDCTTKEGVLTKFGDILENQEEKFQMLFFNILGSLEELERTLPCLCCQSASPVRAEEANDAKEQILYDIEEESAGSSGKRARID